MGKRSRKARSSANPRTKFVIIGIVCAVVAVGIAAVAMNPSATNTDSPKSFKLSLDTRGGSPVLGDISAPVTIVEFGDYQCPFCKRWNESTKPAIEKGMIETGKASLIYIDFPIISEDSLTVHAGSYCAEEQGLYWKYHDFMYANQGHENDGWASPENIKTLASKIDGLDADLFGKCLDSGKYEKRVDDNKKIATDAGARSTPTFIIIGPDGGQMIAGAQPYSTFKEIIDGMLG
jgi:protein-disulfide isomerase